MSEDAEYGRCYLLVQEQISEMRRDNRRPEAIAVHPNALMEMRCEGESQYAYSVSDGPDRYLGLQIWLDRRLEENEIRVLDKLAARNWTHD